MASSLPQLNLVVLRSPDIERAVQFYNALGLVFTRHAHGNGPDHYSSETGGMVFELYPATAKHPTTTSTRIGFLVDDVNNRLNSAMEQGAEVVTPPGNSEWGRRAVVRDLDGHVVELIERTDEK